jgi:S1-C subfamily serine protease
VTRDRAALEEMFRRSGQTGVPVIVVDGELMVGFNRPRLEQLLSKAGTARPGPGRPGLGLRVADAQRMADKITWLAGRSGAYVGGVNPGSPGAQAGVVVGDLVVAVDGQPITSASDLERVAASGRHRHVLTLVNQGNTRQVVVNLAP